MHVDSAPAAVQPLTTSTGGYLRGRRTGIGGGGPAGPNDVGPAFGTVGHALLSHLPSW